MAYSLCGSSVDNTGEQECDKSRGVGRKLFITAAAIAPADFATKEAFMAKLVANSKLSKNHPDKVFPINELQDIADNSEANKEGSLNLGFSAVLLEGKPKYTFKVFAGSDLLKRYRSFNNQTVRIIEYDANGVFWVTKVGANAKGFQFKLFTTGNKLATGQAVEEGVVTITASVMSNTEYLDNCFWVESNGSVEDIKALIDVQLAYVSNASNVYKYSAKIPGSNLTGDYSILPTYGSAIAALVADFSAKSGAGVPATSLAITSISYDSTLDALTVTYDSTAYTSATGNIMLVPPTPAQLDTGSVPDSELLSVTHPKA